MIVETIRNESTKSLETSNLEITYFLPRPKSFVVRFGRVFVVVAETIHNIDKIVREVLEGLKIAFAETSQVLFHARLPHPEQHPLRIAPTWTFRNQALRANKKIAVVNPHAKPILNITKKALSTLGCAAPNVSAAIPNGQNCCFMASCIQALRVSPSFRTRLKAQELVDMPVVQHLRKIYSIIEGKNKRDLTSSEINDFRKTCLESGYLFTSEQEDGQELFAFLLSQVGFESFQIKEHNEHSFPIRVNALEKGMPLKDNMLVFQVGSSKATELKDLIVKREMVVDVERKNVENILSEAEELTEEEFNTLTTMQDVEPVQVKQTMQFYRSDLPHILPVYLARESYDILSHKTSINTQGITANKQIDIPLADLPGYA
ncbi:MAG: hypothetical protein JSR37_07975, partial [Verrucomicrobia bacterium]|nr:hypothetical protein [Verrucomicrobiota bacterium]